MADMQTFTSFDGLADRVHRGRRGPRRAAHARLRGERAAQLGRAGHRRRDPSQSGRRVIAYDARGHGESDKPHDPAAYENDAMRRDAQALLDHLGDHDRPTSSATRWARSRRRVSSRRAAGAFARARRHRRPPRGGRPDR